jgi:hypothetical protein
MKRLSIFCLLFAAIAYSFPSQAQFFKKLKKAVNNTVNSVSSEINEDSNHESDAQGGLYTVEATHTDLSVYHPVGIYTLQPGEKFDFTESCLAMQPGSSSAQIVVIKNGERYLIGRNGERTKVTEDTLQVCPATYLTNTKGMMDFYQFAYNAPNVDKNASGHFNDLFIHSYNGISGSMQMNNHLTPQQEQQMEQLADNMEKEQDTGSLNMADAMKAAQMARGLGIHGSMHYNKDSAGTFISFNQKRYGPYAGVNSMMVNKADNKFVAIVWPGDPDMPNAPVGTGSLLITSEGLQRKIPFRVAEILPFGDFNHYRLRTTDNNLNQILYDPATGEKIILKNLPGAEMEIDKSTGAILQIADNKVYVDGKLTNTPPGSDHIKPKDIFISKDHKHAAVWRFDGLSLPDGNTIDGILSCRKQIEAGKTILNFIVLGSNNKTLYLCHTVL